MALLEAQGLTVRYGDHLAVDNVSIGVDKGCIAGLIGPNGAGKSSAFAALAGVQKCTGTVMLGGVDISRKTAQARAKLGLNRTFQRLEVFGSMTAFENVLAASETQAAWGISGGAKARRVAWDLIDRLDLREVADQRADALPTGQARLVELARALATEPRVLLLDEPASGLDERETARLAEVLCALRDDGTAILLVEHDIEFVMGLCSEVFVQNLGSLIARGRPDEIRSHPEVREAYLGDVA